MSKHLTSTRYLVTNEEAMMLFYHDCLVQEAKTQGWKYDKPLNEFLKPKEDEVFTSRHSGAVIKYKDVIKFVFKGKLSARFRAYLESIVADMPDEDDSTSVSCVAVGGYLVELKLGVVKGVLAELDKNSVA